MSLWECVLLCQVYWKWCQDTTVMLQMSLKEMSYFSYKPLSSSCPCLSTLLSCSSVTHPFTVISYLRLMKEKQPLLITMTPWELATVSVCVCVMWTGVMRHNIVASPPLWVLLSQKLLKCKGVQPCALWWKSTLTYLLEYFIYMQNSFSLIFEILANILLSTFTIKLYILEL